MSQTMNIHIEYRQKSGFSEFFGKIGGRRVCMMYDVNTAPYARAFGAELSAVGCEIREVAYPDRELIPSEDKCALAEHAADGCDYVLAVGSGTLNDMAKSVATRLGIPSGVLATAASMDGYCSAGAALMRGGVKVKEVNPSTMESKLCPGLYLAGEMLDVDGFTGGFNLQVAFSTGYCAGMSAAQE
jgi:glycerol dehydrogenase-like iron-containing ADH family enzyme